MLRFCSPKTGIGNLDVLSNMAPNMTIKAILLDVGGTLIKVTPSVGHIYSQVAKRHGLRVPTQKLNERFETAWKRRQSTPKNYTRQWWRGVVYDVFGPDSSPLGQRFFNDVYNSFLNASAWKVFPDVIPFLKAISSKKVPIYVASNWDYRLPRILRNVGLHSYFSKLYVSCYLKTSKPDPAFFQKILSDLKLPASHVVHIGDEKQNDVIAPRCLGIRAFHVRSNGRGLLSVLKQLYLNG